MLKQRTLKSAVEMTGVGVHSGRKVTLICRPSPANSGITFRRIDIDPVVTLRADPFLVGDTRLASCLEYEGVKVSTVEHLMSALAGLGIDNAEFEVNAEELPILDGSAGPFVYLIQSAGIVEQEAPKKFIRVKKTVEIRDGEKWAKLNPYEGFSLEFEIAFNHPVIDHSSGSTFHFDFTDGHYVRDVARARTFGFAHEVEYLRSNGLAQGGSLGNAIVLDDYRVLNEEGLRYKDEFVRHKVLDAIGDLYLFGHPMLAAFSAYKSGHALNNMLLRMLYADCSAWEWVTFEKPGTVPTGVLHLFPDLQPQLV